MFQAQNNGAIAYYRCASSEKYEPGKDPISLQRNAIQAFAAKHSIEIIHESIDEGCSGLNGDRPGFKSIFEDWILNPSAPRFEYVLMTDVSRFGRFQNFNEADYWESLCHKNKKTIVYTDSASTPLRSSLYRHPDHPNSTLPIKH